MVGGRLAIILVRAHERFSMRATEMERTKFEVIGA